MIGLQIGSSIEKDIADVLAAYRVAAVDVGKVL